MRKSIRKLKGRRYNKTQRNKKHVTKRRYKRARKRRTRGGGKKVKFYLGEKEEGEKSLGEIRDEKKKKSIPKQRKLPVTPVKKQRKLPVTPVKVAPVTSRASPAPTLFKSPLTPEKRLARRRNRAKWWRLQAKNEYDELLRQIDEDEIPLPTTPEERLQLNLKVRNARRKAYPDPDADFS